MIPAGSPRMKMLVICPFPQGVAAGQRLKYEQYFDRWRSDGFDISVSSFMDIRMWNVVYSRGNYLQKVLGVLRGHWRRLCDLLRICRYDVVYVFMWVTPFGTSLMERLTRRLARRLVFDLEDNVIGRPSGASTDHPNAILQSLKGAGKARYLVRKADHVITSSPPLNDRCLKLNERRACTYVSSSVDTDRFVPRGPRGGHGTVTIGWTGTFSSSGYLNLLRSVFQALAQKVAFKLKIIGNFDWDLPGVDLEVVRWSAATEVEDLQSLDIGVYPVAIEEFATGKSGLKAIQYMAFGLPTVATRYGTTLQIIRDRENGLLVTTDEEWVAALERLVRDADLRRRLGDAARRDAVAKYSIKAVAVDYRRVLATVMEIKDE